MHSTMVVCSTSVLECVSKAWWVVGVDLGWLDMNWTSMLLCIVLGATLLCMATCWGLALAQINCLTACVTFLQHARHCTGGPDILCSDIAVLSSATMLYIKGLSCTLVYFYTNKLSALADLNRRVMQKGALQHQTIMEVNIRIDTEG